VLLVVFEHVVAVKLLGGIARPDPELLGVVTRTSRGLGEDGLARRCHGYDTERRAEPILESDSYGGSGVDGEIRV